jgi:murein DD-endopeptidase MepM/ murein hydrolase activator NlpD
VDIQRGDMTFARNLMSTFTVVDASFPRQKIRLSRSKSRLITSGRLNEESVDLSLLWKGDSAEEKMWDSPFLMPTAGRISSVFGARRVYGETLARWGHSGMDIANKEGTPIAAPAGGEVLYSSDLEAHGGTIILDHGHDVFSIYHHLSKRGVLPGERVHPGDVLGEMGQTGLTTGPHLHWSLAVNGEKVNPVQWTETHFE